MFVKGKSGNPGGRPKRAWTWAYELERAVEELEGKTGKPFRELVARRVVLEAANGNVFAIKELFNRMDGMPKQLTEVTGQNGDAIRLFVNAGNGFVPATVSLQNAPTGSTPTEPPTVQSTDMASKGVEDNNSNNGSSKASTS